MDTVKVNWVVVVSSRISRVHYDHATLVLTVKFKGGRVYKCAPVTVIDYASLLSSGSIGAGYQRVIVGNPDIKCAEVRIEG